METSRTNAQYKRNYRYNLLYEIEWILSVLWIYFVRQRRQIRQIQRYGNQALSLVSISLYELYECRIHSISYNTLYLSFLLYWAVVREVSIKLYLSYEFFSYDRHDRYNDMETRLNFLFSNQAHALNGAIFLWLLDTRAFLLLILCILLISKHMIFLVQFGINRHL